MKPCVNIKQLMEMSWMWEFLCAFMPCNSLTLFLLSLWKAECSFFSQHLPVQVQRHVVHKTHYWSSEAAGVIQSQGKLFSITCLHWLQALVLALFRFQF